MRIADVVERGEAQQLFLDQPIDDRLLLRPGLAFLELRLLRDRGLHQRRDVEGGDLELAAEEVAGDRILERARALVPLDDVLRERAADDLLELGVDLGIDAREARDLRLLHELHGLEVGLAEEEPSPREHLPEDDAEREHVGARVDRLTECGLRGEVAELALHDAGVGLLELRRRFGETEVGDLHLAALAEQDVRR